MSINISNLFDQNPFYNIEESIGIANKLSVNTVKVEDQLFVGTNENTVQCFDKQGTKIWSINLGWNSEGYNRSIEQIIPISSRYLMVLDNSQTIHFIDSIKREKEAITFTLVFHTRERKDYLMLSNSLKQQMPYSLFCEHRLTLLSQKNLSKIQKSSGCYIAKVMENGIVRFTDARNVDNILNIIIPLHNKKISCIDLSDNLIVFSDDSENAYIADLHYPSVKHVFLGHQGVITDIKWITDNLLLTSSKDKTVRVWDTNSYQCLHVYQYEESIEKLEWNQGQLITVHSNHHLELRYLPTEERAYWQTLRKIVHPVIQDTIKADHPFMTEDRWTKDMLRHFDETVIPQNIEGIDEPGICHGISIASSAYWDGKEIKLYPIEERIEKWINYQRIYEKKLEEANSTHSKAEINVPYEIRNLEGISKVERFKVDVNLFMSGDQALGYLIKQTYKEKFSLDHFPEAKKWFKEWLNAHKFSIFSALNQQELRINQLELELFKITKQSNTEQDAYMLLSINTKLEDWENRQLKQAHSISIQILHNDHLVIEEPSFGVWHFTKEMV